MTLRLLSLLLAATCAPPAFANPQAPAPAAKAASKPAIGSQPAVKAPNAGGNGGGLSSNGGNTAGQVTPKKPKCPDPTSTACPAIKTPAQ